jgi:hypothetical protein
MRTLVVVMATTLVMLAGLPDATTLTGPADDRPEGNYSPIEKVDCINPGGERPWGKQRSCGPGFCWCAPGGGLWRLWRRS